MLGYAFAEEVGYRGVFGPGEGPIWMDYVQCNGTEESIDQCNFPGWGIHSCSHYSDASVVCASEWCFTTVELWKMGHVGTLPLSFIKKLIVSITKSTRSD